ncbi:orotidine 5'-phosphate decarboxylase [Alicyclobacillus hesperidum]|uniref:Orotidine 5'-phosphate decarboxylase n=1 Tax=Alicyclobacillus hesperidum TaxID=89784 RepID=A0A1H2UX85_9BACL|nr:orotidine-5'-phosphate decarboxylase [Alicyclobacillus hesperidum]GLV14599.1 orotidine 5'-phosphate decarboxylase [Alicyclobacillus hesperidum]SDW60696.1 orotidine-5'-phosphate decarboxylase [Alicyclobacillus hesperidum]
MSIEQMTELLATTYDDVRRATYIALDVDTEAKALAVVDQLGPAVDGYKVGLELFHGAGMRLVEKLLARGLRVFLDMKLHDIPNTVAGALRAICQYPIEMVNVHAQGGPRMLQAAREAVAMSPYNPLLIGVTVLTSLGDDDLQVMGVAGGPAQAVVRLSKLVQEAGLDGVVCSAQELQLLQDVVPPTFERVVPGTRLLEDAAQDQTRVATPKLAMRDGATRLVLGRAVVAAEDPLSALQKYWRAMKEGLNG